MNCFSTTMNFDHHVGQMLMVDIEVRLRKSFADNMIEIQDDYRNSLSKLDIIPVVSHLNSLG